MIKIIKYFFESIFIYLFFFIIKIIGLFLSRKLFSFIFKIVGPMIKSKKIIKKNLLKFSKSLSNDERDQIISNMWSNYGMTFVEYIYLKRFKKETSHIKIIGGEILDQISQSDKPVIFISGHFANFELMSMEITKKKIKLATIYRPLNNFFLNPFMEFLRKKYICKNQIKKGRKGVKESIDYIRKNNSLAVMIDQRVSEGEKINFFNEEALTSTLPAQLAFKFNLDIVPIFIERKLDNSFVMQVYEPINTKKFKNKLKLSKQLNQILEGMILKNPNQWIWSHDRWK
ncbi:MAG: KDO2-lipid IV(A) lauroyltransferase [Pelagibacterales bacterium]|nr:KDO2-lipid IV(A) lauroyltransferase [Pelagibacterales bacterium]